MMITEIMDRQRTMIEALDEKFAKFSDGLIELGLVELEVRDSEDEFEILTTDMTQEIEKVKSNIASLWVEIFGVDSGRQINLIEHDPYEDEGIQICLMIINQPQLTEYLFILRGLQILEAHIIQQQQKA
jgi:hypothetical protein